MSSRGRVLATLAGALAFALVAAGTAGAERAWVKDELRLNVRTGPGVRYRIVGGLQTGDAVEILSRGEGWTQVRGRDGLEGWIPAGYLQADPPARLRLERSEAETARLRERTAELSTELEKLRADNASLGEEQSGREEELARLTHENLQLRAGARWPEWIAGAAILFVGGILGILVRRSAVRRPGSRIRL